MNVKRFFKGIRNSCKSSQGNKRPKFQPTFETVENRCMMSADGFGQPELWVDNFGVNAGWEVDKHPRMMADVNGDGRDDVVGFGDQHVLVSLSTGNGFTEPTHSAGFFGYNNAWRTHRHPRMMADVNGDGNDDVVGFGNAGVYISRSNGSSFSSPTLASDFFDYDSFWRVEHHPRFMADVNGDGMSDVVGFGASSTYVALSTGSGFGAAETWSSLFGYDDGWRVDKHPRIMTDVNGDGRDDIVGFGDDGVHVSLSTGSSFSAPTISVGFGYDGGWRVDKHPRMAADVNGDGLSDVVGFGYGSTYVALSTGSGFATPTQSAEFFGHNNGWRIDEHPRYVFDVSGDGRDDIVGFGHAGVSVSLSNGNGFENPFLASPQYGQSTAWHTDQHPRMMADVDGDGKSDIVGIGIAGAYVSISGSSDPMPGDANLDVFFNSSDLVQVFQSAKYEEDLPAGWGAGDWNGDHRFDSSDLILAFQTGSYEQLSLASAHPSSFLGDPVSGDWALAALDRAFAGESENDRWV